MYAYKATAKGLICRGYQFRQNEVNHSEAANCAQNGFHCALNPLDCFHYYPDIQSSEYWLVDAGGDVDEDARDSKIACTELRFLRQLSPIEMGVHGLLHLTYHPERLEQYCGDHGSYIIQAGSDPTVEVTRSDVIAGIIKHFPNNETGIAAIYVDGETVLPGVYDYARMIAIQRREG